MGTYRVWIATGEDNRQTDDRTAWSKALELIEPYDESNDIPGDWPGLSYDYYHDEIDVKSAGLLLEETESAQMPHLLVREGPEQHRLEGEGTERERLELAGLLADPGELVAVMDWHS